MDEQAPGIISALFLVGLAEIGDKSHLMAMAMGARHPWAPVLVGAALAYAVLNLLAVTVGAALSATLPPAAIAGAAALVFTASGVLTLRDTDSVEAPSEGSPAVSGASLRVALSAAGVLLLAELGDRTQIAVSAMAASAAEQSPGIWLGATLGMLGHAALGVWLGQALLQRLPETTVRRAAALLFFVFAALASWQALAALQQAG